MQLWRTKDRGSTGGSEQNHTQEKEKQDSKVVIWGRLTKSWGKKKMKKQGEKWKVNPTKCRVPENSREGQEGLFNEQCK